MFLVLQVKKFCTPLQLSCYDKLRKKDFNCTHYCAGLYADVVHTQNNQEFLSDPQMLAITKSYNEYKTRIARNIHFSGEEKNGGMFSKQQKNILIRISFSVSTLPYNVQFVNIYLSTATFDEIDKDVKVRNWISQVQWVPFSYLSWPNPQ